MSPRNARVEIMHFNVEYFYNELTDDFGPKDSTRVSIISSIYNPLPSYFHLNRSKQISKRNSLHLGTTFSSILDSLHVIFDVEPIGNYVWDTNGLRLKIYFDLYKYKSYLSQLLWRWCSEIHHTKYSLYGNAWRTITLIFPGFSHFLMHSRSLYWNQLLVLSMNKNGIRKVPKSNTKLNCILKLEKVIFWRAKILRFLKR